MAHARNAQDVSTLLRGWCTCANACGAAAWNACCLRQPAWLHETRCFDTALAHRLQMPIVASRGGDGNSPAAPTVRLVHVRLGIGTTLSPAMQVRLAGGTTWALPPSAGKCTQHTVWGRAGKAGKGRTHAHQRQNVSDTRAHQRWCAWVPPKKETPRTCCCCNGCAIRAQTANPNPQFYPHRSHPKAPFAGPQTLRASGFCSVPSKCFLHQVHVTAWLHNAATHRSRRPWRECVIGSFAAAAVRQGLGRASLRGDAAR